MIVCCIFSTVGIITCFSSATFVKASPIASESLTLYWSELQAMCKCTLMLLQVPRPTLDFNYAALIRTPNNALSFLPHLTLNERRFGCLNPAYRQRPPLKHGLVCDPMILALCNVSTGCNVLITTTAEMPFQLCDRPIRQNEGNQPAGGQHQIRYVRVTLPLLGNGTDDCLRNAVNGQPPCTFGYGRHQSHCF